MAKGAEIVVGKIPVAPGTRQTIDLPVADLYTHGSLHMPVQVINGRQSGPTLFVSAAIHGDELNGVEIIRRLLKLSILNRLRGTLIAVPIVNVHGFLDLSRYLPDRRDLNRSFPGSDRGSIAARLAHLFANEIVAKADCGIDLHTGAIHRSNLPQIRADLDDNKTMELAQSFGVPVLLNSNIRDGSLREFACDKGIPMLLYEAGEALRFDELSIKGGMRGIIRVMRKLRMLPQRKSSGRTIEPVVAKSSSWLRAPRSGIVRLKARLGDRIKKDQTLGVISDPFGESETEMPSFAAGIVIARSNLPVAHEGDALLHIARFESARVAEETVGEFQTAHDPNTPL